MKFDMGRAWSDAIALLRANGQLVAIVAGAFFFLPYLALMLLIPDTVAGLETTVAEQGDATAQLRAVSTIYGSIWWQLLLVTVFVTVGMLGLLALLTDRGRPTVGEALKSGVIYFLPYIGAQILLTIVFVGMLLVTLLVGRAAGPAVGTLLGILALIGAVYVYIKFSLAVPVIVAEKVMNPISALRRSWSLTKGNSVRLFVFYLLLIVAIVVIALVIGLVVGLLQALAGPDSSAFLGGLLNAVLNAIVITLYLAVLAAIHRQLAGTPPETLGETFE